MSFLQFTQPEVSPLLSNPLLFSVLSIFLVLFLVKWLFPSPKPSKIPPPSPWKLPLIGNIHHLGLSPHRSLQSLSRKHGPIMLLHFGRVPVLVVSSADVAREILKTHDVIFSERPKSTTIQRLLYDRKDLLLAPYGEYWRQNRSIYVLQLLSNRRVESFRSVRMEEVSLMLEKIREFSASSCPMNLSEMFVSLTNNVISRAAMGRKHGEGERGEKFKQLLREMLDILAAADVGDFLPWLSWVNRLSGFDAKVTRIAKGLDKFLEDIIKDRKDGSGGAEVEDNTQADFLDVLLDAYKDKLEGTSVGRDCTKALILTAFVAAVDTSTTFLEWAMTEILRNPRVMKKLQTEVREIINGRVDITEDDFEKMHYLKAVIKETFRFHPPATLLPRSAREDVKVMGYDVAAGTMVMINFWAIVRDPACWDEPEEFKPERFVDCAVDFRGHDFEFIPFGAGRRGCRGMSFAMALNEMVLANLMHKFDWNLPGGMKAEDLDVTECFATTVHRKFPLLALATPCSG